MFSGGCAYCWDSPCTCTQDEITHRCDAEEQRLKEMRASLEAMAPEDRAKFWSNRIEIAIEPTPLAITEAATAIVRAFARMHDQIAAEVFTKTAN